MKYKYEPNPFEDPKIAKEWIVAVETFKKDRSREKYVYPKLYQWSKGLKLKQGIILEVGAGQGICSEKIFIGKGRYIGIEPSSYLVKRARQLYRQKNKKFFVGNAYKLPVKANTADAAFSVFVWFHLKNINKAAKELARVLKKLGRFYILTANPAASVVWESFFEKHGRYTKRGKMFKGAIGVSTGILSKNIIYLHSLSEMIRSLEKHDLRIADIETFDFVKEDTIRGTMIGIEGYKGYRKF